MSDTQLLKIEVKISARLDQILLEELRASWGPSLSRSTLKRFLRDHPVLIDGKNVSPSTEIAPGDHVISLKGFREFLEAAKRPLERASECFLPIVYEDNDLLVLHKTSGVPSVSLSSDETHSAAAAALAHFPGLAQIPGVKPLEPGLLHRLDTGTSGLLAFAKSEKEFKRLKNAWKTKDVRKTYRAIVAVKNGSPPPKICTLNSPIARPQDSSRRMIVMREGKKIRGEPLKAVTHIKKVRKLSNGHFDLEIEIETGVMHQIRTHLANEGWPIVGDKTYGGVSGARLMLHAWKLELPHKNGNRLMLEAELPKGFV